MTVLFLSSLAFAQETAAEPTPVVAPEPVLEPELPPDLEDISFGIIEWETEPNLDIRAPLPSFVSIEPFVQVLDGFPPAPAPNLRPPPPAPYSYGMGNRGHELYPLIYPMTTPPHESNALALALLVGFGSGHLYTAGHTKDMSASNAGAGFVIVESLSLLAAGTTAWYLHEAGNLDPVLQLEPVAGTKIIAGSLGAFAVSRVVEVLTAPTCARRAKVRYMIRTYGVGSPKY